MSETLYESSRTHAHEGTVLLVAAQSMGVYINDADRLYIRTVSKLAAVIDDIVDNEGDFPDIAGILTDPVGRLSGRLSEKDTTVVLEGIHEFTARQQDTLMAAELLPEYADAKRSASTVRELSTALSSEALLFTRLFSLDTGTTEDSNAENTSICGYNTFLGADITSTELSIFEKISRRAEWELPRALEIRHTYGV